MCFIVKQTMNEIKDKAQWKSCDWQFLSMNYLISILIYHIYAKCILKSLFDLMKQPNWIDV